MCQITAAQWYQWRDAFYNNTRQKRLGEAFVNEHNLHNDHLFWLDPDTASEQVISELYVRF